MTSDALKRISLLQELEIGIETIKSALSLIQSIHPDNIPIFLIFLILSTGLERIFKVVIGLRMWTDLHRFLTEEELRAYGHDLSRLKRDLLSSCFDRQNLDSQIKRDDYEYLRDDKLLNALLMHLGEFSKNGRYVYMNRIADDNATGKWLSHRWEEIERQIIPLTTALELDKEGKYDEYTKVISDALVKCIERLLGALGRIITLGNMNAEANSAGTLLYEFVLIRNSELGKKRYKLFGPTPI